MYFYDYFLNIDLVFGTVVVCREKWLVPGRNERKLQSNCKNCEFGEELLLFYETDNEPGREKYRGQNCLFRLVVSGVKLRVERFKSFFCEAQVNTTTTTLATLATGYAFMGAVTRVRKR